jgi:DASH complex subunit SPC19
LQHFELVSESELNTAQSALAADIRPQIEWLLTRVSNYLDKMDIREQSLIAKYDLNEGRLNREPDHKILAPLEPSQTVGAGRRLSSIEELKLRQLRQKKERLSYAVDRLTLQAQQRQRLLRMSMAAPQQHDF